MSTYKKLTLILILILLFSSVVYAGHYEFAGDGARGKAMGGAFVALADDATAYSWNPAGMVLLKKTRNVLYGKNENTKL